MIIEEEDYRDNEELFKLLWENSSDLIVIISPLEDFKVEMVNENRLLEVLGCDSKDLIGNSFFKYIKPIDFKKVIKQLTKGPELKKILKEIRIKSKIGKEIVVEITIKRFKNKNNEEKLFLKLKDLSGYNEFKQQLESNDITDSVATDKKLKESEEKYYHLFENSPYGIILLDLNGKILDWNSTTEKIFTFKKKSYISSEFLELPIFSKKHIPILKKRLEDRTEGNKLEPFQLQIFKRDGTLAWINPQFSRIKLGEQDIIQIIVEDITERKIAEQEIKESEQKFRTIAEQLLMGIIILQNNLIKYVNHRAAEIVGYTSQEMKSWKKGEFQKFIHPEDKSWIIEQSIMNQTESSNIKNLNQFRLIKKSGEIVWIEGFSERIDYRGRLARLITIIDITGRKKAEEQLKESEKRYKHIFENSPESMILVDKNGNILDYNTLSEKIFGFSKMEVIGKNFTDLDIFTREQLKIFKKRYKKHLKGEKPKPVEFQVKRKDENLLWINFHSSLLMFGNENLILCFTRDITERKKAEHKLIKSEKRYRDLLETSSVAVIEIDMIQSNLSYVNTKFLNLTGYSREELNQEGIYLKIFYKDDIRKIMSVFEDTEIEFRIISKNSKIKWVSGKSKHYHDKFGDLIRVRLWVEDITERMIYEKLIEELNINFLNYTTDTQKNIELLLNTCCELLNGELALYIFKTIDKGKEGYSVITSDKKFYSFTSEEFKEKIHASELFLEFHDFPQIILNLNQNEYAKSDPFIQKYNIKGGYGKLIKAQNQINSLIYVLYKENPIPSHQDQLVLFLICDAVEIEQQRWQILQHLKEQNKMLSQINALKTELFSRTSHELKTPLISIKGFTELLLTFHSKKFDTEIIKMLEEIKDGSIRLEKIVNSLLETSKLEQGKLELNMELKNLSFLIKFCASELKGLVQLRNQSLLLDIHDDLITKFDKERIYEVLSNILVNAIKYTPPGGEIAIQTEIEDDSYIVSIKDNGIGLTEEDKDILFTQFGKIERYGQGWNIGIEGSGLGLFISKKIIELHNGKIWVESEGRNQGSTFYFSLPIIS